MLQQHRVLVVDDDEAIRVLAKTVVEHACGAVCDMASDGEEAIAALSNNQYTLIVLDLMLPRVDGWSVMHHMRLAGIRTPVVIITAAGPKRISELDHHIVKAVLAKPFEVAHFISVVKGLCA